MSRRAMHITTGCPIFGVTGTIPHTHCLGRHPNGWRRTSVKSVSSVLGDYMRLALKESVESIGLNFEFLHSRNEQINKFSLPKKIRTGCIKILKAGASEIESEQINAPKTYEDFFSTPSFKNSRRFFFENLSIKNRMQPLFQSRRIQ